jgi:hypothetical protein
MRHTVETQQLRHPVLWDQDCRNTKRYGIETWPYAFLIGPDGTVFWEGNPARWFRRAKRVQEMRALIEKKLFEGNGHPGLFYALSRESDVVHFCSHVVAQKSYLQERR